MRRSHVQHNTARVPRRTPFWPKPQKGAKTLLFPGAKRATPYGVPDGAEPVEGKFVSPHVAGVRENGFYADASGGRMPPAWADLSSPDSARTECSIYTVMR